MKRYVVVIFEEETAPNPTEYNYNAGGGESIQCASRRSIVRELDEANEVSFSDAVLAVAEGWQPPATMEEMP